MQADFSVLYQILFRRRLVQINREHFNTTSQHFIDNLIGGIGSFFFCRSLFTLHIDFIHALAHGGTAFCDHCPLEVLAADGEIGRIIFHGLVYLIPAKPQRRNHIGSGVGLGEHVFDF